MHIISKEFWLKPIYKLFIQPAHDPKVVAISVTQIVWWNRPTTMFPVSIAMAATWDIKLINEVAAVISDEARAIYNGWHLDPNFQGEKKGMIYRASVRLHEQIEVVASL